MESKEKMVKNKIKLVLSIIMLAVSMILLFITNYDKLDSLFINTFRLYYRNFLKLFLFFDILYLASELLKTITMFQSKRLWLKIVDDLNYKIKEEIKDTSSATYKNDVLSQLLSIYTENDNFVSKMIENTMEIYKENDYVKGELSYFFMANSFNNNIISFFENDSDGQRERFKRDIKEYSKSLSKELFEHDIGSDLVTYGNIGKISMYLLHMSLPQNSINYAQMIHVVRTILTWTCENIDKEFVINNRDDVIILLVSIERIWNRMISMNIKNEEILSYIDKIENSHWFRILLVDAYKNLKLNKKNEEMVIEINKLATEAVLVTSFFNKLPFFKKILLYFSIMSRYKYYKKTYYRQDGQATLKLLLAAVPLGAIKENGNISDQISVLIATIARNL